MEPDYYTILGVSPTASVDEIRRAYRRLARTYHPDRNGSSPVYVERMKTINAARDLLSDPARRGAYDARRFEETRPKAPPPRPAHDAPVADGAGDREQRRRQRERETAAWEAGTYRFGGQSPYTRRSAANAYARDRGDFAFGHRRRAGAGWAGCLMGLIGFGLIFCLGISSVLTARSIPEASENSPPTMNSMPPPAPVRQMSDGNTHSELCRALLLHPGVLTAAADPDGETIVVTTLPNTSLPDRIDVAWKIDTYMDSRLHQRIDDRLTSIRIVPDGGTDPPIILLPGRESWGIQMPEGR